MARRWLGLIGGTTHPPTTHHFRPRLEGMDDRIVPNATSIAPSPLGAQAAVAATAEAAANTTVAIDFTNFADQVERQHCGPDTLTITIWNDGPTPTVITVDVGGGSTPAAVASAVAGSLRNAGYTNVTVNGNIVTFDGENICTVNIEHTNNDNGNPSVTISRVDQ